MSICNCLFVAQNAVNGLRVGGGGKGEAAGGRFIILHNFCLVDGTGARGEWFVSITPGFVLRTVCILQKIVV